MSKKACPIFIAFSLYSLQIIIYIKLILDMGGKSINSINPIKCKTFLLISPRSNDHLYNILIVVIASHVTIVVNGNLGLKTSMPRLIGCVLCSAASFRLYLYILNGVLSTGRSIYCRNSVLHLHKSMFYVRLSRCSTDL